MVPAAEVEDTGAERGTGALGGGLVGLRGTPMRQRLPAIRLLGTGGVQPMPTHAAEFT